MVKSPKSEKLFGSRGILPCRKCGKSMWSDQLKKHTCKAPTTLCGAGGGQAKQRCWKCGGDRWTEQCAYQLKSDKDGGASD